MYRLWFDNIVLLVHIETFVFDFNRIDIRGKIHVDSVNNSLYDMDTCFGTCFEKKPILEVEENDYELMITNLHWDTDPMEFGYVIKYECDFIAIPLENKNNVIWDSMSPISQIALGYDVDDLVAFADEAVTLIEKHRDYRASFEYPIPSSMEGGNCADDVAAVITGSIPATMFEVSSLNSLVVLLLKEACALGKKIETVDNFNGKKMIVVGLPYNVQAIVQILNDENINYEHLGLLFGIPRKNIKEFIKEIDE